MKYLAILKDSFREAVDAKVLYVMIGLSSLMILFVATLSFRPLPAKKTMEWLVSGLMNEALDAYKPKLLERMHEKRRIGAFSLVSAEAVRGEIDSPDSDYRLTVETDGAPDKAGGDAVASFRSQLQPLENLGLIKIGDVALATVQVQDGLPERTRVIADVQATSGTRRIWLCEPSLFFGAVPLGSGDFGVPLGMQLHFLSSLIVSIGSWVVILTGVIISSFFIPNMLRKGTLDLLLAKPIRRPALLIYKYIGGLFFIFLNNVFALVGVWFVLGLRTGIWANWFLLTIFVLTFFFAILYSVSTLVGVMTRSIVAAILITCGVWFLFFVVGTAYQFFDGQAQAEARLNLPPEKQKWTNNSFGNVVKVIHAVTPRTSDLGYLTQVLLLTDFLTGDISKARELTTSSINWTETLLVSGIFIAIMLGLSCWWFATRDY